MDPALLITLIGVVVSSIAAVIAAFYAWKNSRQVQEVHLSLNSRLDAFIKAAELAGQARGAADARAADKAARAEAHQLAIDHGAERDMTQG